MAELVEQDSESACPAGRHAPSRQIVLLSEVFPPVHGGSGRWFAEMYPRLTGADITYVVGDHPKANELDAQRGWDARRWQFGWHFGGLEDVRQMAKHFGGVIQLRRFLRRHPAQQLHAARPLSEGLVAALACPRSTRLVCYTHGEDISVARTSRQLSWVTRWTLSRCDRVIANSANTQQMLLDDWQVPPEKIVLLHPGVDCGRFQASANREQLRQDLHWQGRRVLLTVGRLQRRKGQDTAIHAASRLAAKFPDLLWVIAGEGEDRSYLQSLIAKLGVQQQVCLSGAVDDNQLSQMYQAADLFVLPNRTIDRDMEGFGMVLLEAQASGLPVIAGDSGGTVDAVADDYPDCIIDCSDVENPSPLVHQITRMLTDDQRRAQQATAGKIWASRFDWSLVARRADLCFSALS